MQIPVSFSAFDILADGVVIIDRDFTVVFANRSVLSDCGLDAREVIGRKCHELFHQCSLPCEFPEQCPHKEIFATGKPTTVMHAHRCAGGEKRYYDISASPITNEKGEVELVIEVLRDSTLREMMAAKLREATSDLQLALDRATTSEKQLQSVLENVGIGIAVISPVMEVLSMNRRMKDWFPAIDTSTKPVCYTAFNNPPGARPCAYCPTIKTLNDGRVHESVTETPQGGETRHYRIISSPLKDSGGMITAAIEMVEDITEVRRSADLLRENEEFIRNILESVGEGFIVVDRNFRIISANRAFCEQVKCRTDQIIGKPCYEVSHHISRPCFLEGEECAPAVTFRTGAPHVSIHTHFDADGLPVYVETKSYPMKDASGEISTVIEILNNITEKRNLEGQLRHAQKMEAIGTLAGGIAHDFNNMLSVIIGYGDILKMRMKENDPHLPQLKEILIAAEKASQLTRGLLAFSSDRYWR